MEEAYFIYILNNNFNYIANGKCRTGDVYGKRGVFITLITMYMEFVMFKYYEVVRCSKEQT